MLWFVNTGDGVEHFESEAQAVMAAERAIDDWRDCCDPDWPEEVVSVCYGPVFGSAIENEIDDDHVEYQLDSISQESRLPLSDQLRWILGRPNFWCASYAAVLRLGGMRIEHKAEDEQAAVIYWIMTLLLKHGADRWMDVADRLLKDLATTKAVEANGGGEAG